MLGNLLGDFAKGRVAALPYSDEVKFGIELHRAVDTFTDNHEYTKELKSHLGQWRRFAGIILDVYYDHQLAVQFEQIEAVKLEKFAQLCYQQIQSVPDNSPERFKRVVGLMTSMDWLSGYSDINNIERALVGISQRLSTKPDLAGSIEWYNQNQSLFSHAFLAFYQDLSKYCQEYVEKRGS